MAEDNNAPAVAGPLPPAVTLKVLSPSPEVPQNGWVITDVPTSTTVAELKRRIHNVLPSHPPADRQRVLYQGRFLSDAQTLNHAFGQQALSQSREFSVHLVLRQPGTNTPTAARSATPTGVGTPQQAPAPPQAPRMPSGTPELPNPNNLRDPIDPRHPRLPPMNVPPNFPGLPQIPGLPIPPQMLPGIPGFGMPHGNFPMPVQQPVLVNGQPQIPRAVRPPHNPFQHILAQNQQQRAMAGQQGIGTQNNAHQTATREGTGTPTNPSLHPDGVPGQGGDAQNPAQARQPGNQPAQIPGLNGNAIRYNVTINQGTFTIPAMQGAPMPPPPFPFLQNPFVQHPLQNVARTDRGPNTGLPNFQTREALQRDLEHIRSRLTGSETLTREERESLANSLQHVSRTIAMSEPQSEGAHITDAAERTGTAAASQQNPTSLPQVQADQPTVYLLSSPTGPHALVMTPNGVFNDIVATRHTTLSTYSNHQRRSRPTTSGTRAAATPPIEQLIHELENQNRLVLGQPQAAHQAQQQQQPEAANAIQGIMAQFWLLLRIMIFVYVFMGSGFGWRRPLVVAGVGLLFWLVRGGFVGQGAQGRVQRWWEDVTGAQGEQDLPQWRQVLRPAERALALFVASLWPGIGERHVAARRAAENERRRLEEAERTREEEARRQEAEAAAATSITEQDQPTENDASATEATHESEAGTAVTVSGAEVREDGDVRARRPPA
ncbi:hypothetical protein H2203_002325 [Taxawa tesnikishii (nom. ined.)]|nr:hypothetical protein H2203_002325 [Dothideales sp. JES 119]